MKFRHEDGSFDLLGELISAPPDIASLSPVVFETDEDQVKAVIRDMCNKDHNVGMKHMHDDCVFVRPTGNPLNKDGWNDMMNNKDVVVESNDLVTIKPITDNQKLVFDAYKEGKNGFFFGCAGTGKTFVTLYQSLQDVLKQGTGYDKVVIVRSLIPTREIGFLPGDEEDKAALYQVPYQNMVQFMFKQPNEDAFKGLYDSLKRQGSLYFLSTSFLRGLTFDNSIIIVDECQNMNDMEINSIITRVGHSSKILFCGDFRQTDLYKRGDLSGLQKFMVIAENMPSFRTLEFDTDDIVRSDLVKEYLMARMSYEEEYGT